MTFSIRVTSYCWLHELRVTFYIWGTSYCSFHKFRVTFIARVTSYFLHTSYELLFIARITSYFLTMSYNKDKDDNPVDTGRKLNVYKTFRGSPGGLLNIFCTSKLRPVSTGKGDDNKVMKRTTVWAHFLIKNNSDWSALDFLLTDVTNVLWLTSKMYAS